nr:hypothetical protein [Ferrimonas balearica]
MRLVFKVVCWNFGIASLTS